MERLEGLLDEQLARKSEEGAGDGAYAGALSSSGGGGIGKDSSKGGAVGPRSLASIMWACGSLSFPLTKDQLDKLAGERVQL